MLPIAIMYNSADSVEIEPMCGNYAGVSIAFRAKAAKTNGTFTLPSNPYVWLWTHCWIAPQWAILCSTPFWVAAQRY